MAKHIQFRRLWLKTAWASGQLDVREVHTSRNAADVLTEALADFIRCVQRAVDLPTVEKGHSATSPILRYALKMPGADDCARSSTCTSCSHSCQCCHISFGSSFAMGSATPHSRHTTTIVRLSPNGRTTPPSCCRRFFDHALSFFSRTWSYVPCETFCSEGICLSCVGRQIKTPVNCVAPSRIENHVMVFRKHLERH